jgi:hypothetical protein
VLPLLGPEGDAMRQELAEVRRRLGAPGASGRAAEVVTRLLAGQKTVDSRDLP